MRSSVRFYFSFLKCAMSKFPSFNAITASAESTSGFAARRRLLIKKPLRFHELASEWKDSSVGPRTATAPVTALAVAAGRHCPAKLVSTALKEPTGPTVISKTGLRSIWRPIHLVPRQRPEALRPVLDCRGHQQRGKMQVQVCGCVFGMCTPEVWRLSWVITEARRLQKPKIYIKINQSNQKIKKI